MDNEKLKLLEEHLKDVAKEIIEVGLDPEKGLGREFLKQTRLVIEQHHEIQDLKQKVAALEGQVQAQPIEEITPSKTLNQLRAEHGLKPIEGGDKYYCHYLKPKLP